MARIRGRRLAPGYYEYVDKPSGVIWRLNFVDKWIPPQWTSEVDGHERNSFGDGLWDRKRDAVESTLDWIDEIYEMCDGLSYDEIHDIRFDPFSDGFKRAITEAILSYMDEESIETFDADEFRS